MTMWPSNIEVKNTLNETGVLLFRDGNLQLNPSIDLAGTILEKDLLISAIDRLNNHFDQKEKLCLAVLLRNYIYSCKEREEAQLDAQNFLKGTYRFLKKEIFDAPLLAMIIIPLSPIITLFRWVALRLNFWYAKMDQSKKKQILNSHLEITLNHNPLKNPLAIFYDPKLYKIPEKKQLVETADLSVEELIEKLTEKLSGNLTELTEMLSINFKRHIGPGSTYELKDLLKDGLQCIYYRLEGHFDRILGPLQEEKLLIDKLLEGIVNCSRGFHTRVNVIIESFNTVENFDQLLYSVRKSLVEKTAITQMRDYHFFNGSGNEVHTYNDFTRLAHQEGLGVPLGTDIYHGDMSWDGIRNALKEEFENSYTLLNLPRLLTETLKGLLIEVGYTGAKEQINPYSYEQVENFSLLIGNYLNPSCYQTAFGDFYLYDDKDEYVVDIHWASIETIFSKQLITENYFKIYGDKEFNQHLLDLVNHIEETQNNYFTLLAQIQPKSFNLLFYRLEKLEKTESKELQEKLIPFLFKKDETGQAPLPLFVQHYPDILASFLRFMDSDLSRQEMLQALLIKHKSMIWDSFISASERQPQSAFIFLKYSIQLLERAESKNHSNCLFLENQSQIQQGLSHLINQQRLDLDQKSTLLRFLKDCPTTLIHTSQKLVDFLFDALSYIDDKSLIEAIINQHSALLLKNFSVNYFKHQNKNLALIVKNLFNAYADELSTRKINRIEYTTHFFNWGFGYSATKKLNALTDLQSVLNDHSADKKIEQLNQLTLNHPSLNNGRLSRLFKACAHDIEITSQIKIQLQS